jgi:hypothetical protein
MLSPQPIRASHEVTSQRSGLRPDSASTNQFKNSGIARGLDLGAIKERR